MGLDRPCFSLNSSNSVRNGTLSSVPKMHSDGVSFPSFHQNSYVLPMPKTKLRTAKRALAEDRVGLMPVCGEVMNRIASATVALAT